MQADFAVRFSLIFLQSVNPRGEAAQTAPKPALDHQQGEWKECKKERILVEGVSSGVCRPDNAQRVRGNVTVGNEMMSK
jgi:hypothetical protein